MAIRDEILAATYSRPLTPVEVPEWGRTVYVRIMSGAERDEWEASCIEIKGKNVKPRMDNTRTRLLVRTLCDEGGGLIFTPADAEALGKAPGYVLDRLFDVAQTVNKLRKEDIDELSGN